MKNHTSCWLGLAANSPVNADINKGVEITRADGGMLGTHMSLWWGLLFSFTIFPAMYYQSECLGGFQYVL